MFVWFVLLLCFCCFYNVIVCLCCNVCVLWRPLLLQVLLFLSLFCCFVVVVCCCRVCWFGVAVFYALCLFAFGCYCVCVVVCGLLCVLLCVVCCVGCVVCVLFGRVRLLLFVV